MENQRVGDYMSPEVRERKNTKCSVSIAAYPQNDIKEIAKIMTDVRIDYLPVFFSPWNKKLVGFIELSKIKVFLKD